MPKVASNKLPELEVTGKTLPEHVKQFKAAIALRKKYEALMEQQKSLVHKLAVKVIPSLLDTEESNGKNFPGIGYLEIGVEVYPYVKKEDEPAFFEWLREEGDGDLIKETIHHKTLQAWASGVIDDPERAGKLPPMLTIGKVPTAVLKAEKKSSKKQK